MKMNELHIALDVPERIRKRIALWVTTLGLEQDEYESPNDYHITVAYAPETERHEQLVRDIPFNFTGMKFEAISVHKLGDADALVIELESEDYEHAAEMVNSWLEDQGVEVTRYDSGWTPHITVAYTLKDPKADLPPWSFRTDGMSFSTPRDAPSIPPLYARVDHYAEQRWPGPPNDPLMRNVAPETVAPYKWRQEHEHEYNDYDRCKICGEPREVSAIGTGPIDGGTMDDNISDPVRDLQPMMAHIAMAEDYWMQHRPPTSENGAPIHAMDVHAHDIYENPHYFMYNDPKYDRESWEAIQAVRGRPNGMVMIHRATPAQSINPGDWVSTSYEYAKAHGMHPDDPSQDLPVASKHVPASSLWWSGDDLNEFGYHP